MSKILQYKVMILILFFLIGNYFINLSQSHIVLAQEENTAQSDTITGDQNNICIDLPEDIVDPGPALPEHLSAPRISKILNTDQGIKIQWNKVKDATGYRILRKTAKTRWKILGTITTNQYIDKTVQNGVTYQYKVYAYAANSIDFIESTGTESITEEFSHLKAPSINQVKRLKNKKSKVSWKKNKKSNGYIVQTSVSNKFNKTTSKKISSAKKVTINMSGLKTNKIYYVRVRSYKINNKKLSYSAWSKIKSIK